MGLAKTVEKLKKYYERLEVGNAKQIKPNHVKRVIEKLKVKEQELNDEMKVTSKSSKKKRIEKKINVTHEQLERAQWLLEKIG